MEETFKEAYKFRSVLFKREQIKQINDILEKEKG
jgi:hypothetical protein